MAVKKSAGSVNLSAGKSTQAKTISKAASKTPAPVKKTTAYSWDPGRTGVGKTQEERQLSGARPPSAIDTSTRSRAGTYDPRSLEFGRDYNRRLAEASRYTGLALQHAADTFGQKYYPGMYEPEGLGIPQYAPGMGSKALPDFMSQKVASGIPGFGSAFDFLYSGQLMPEEIRNKEGNWGAGLSTRPGAFGEMYAATPEGPGGQGAWGYDQWAQMGGLGGMDMQAALNWAGGYTNTAWQMFEETGDLKYAPTFMSFEMADNIGVPPEIYDQIYLPDGTRRDLGAQPGSSGGAGGGGGGGEDEAAYGFYGGGGGGAASRGGENNLGPFRWRF